MNEMMPTRLKVLCHLEAPANYGSTYDSDKGGDPNGIVAIISGPLLGQSVNMRMYAVERIESERHGRGSSSIALLPLSYAHTSYAH